MPSDPFSLLFLGDIFGKTGRKAVTEYLSLHHFDFVIANGENATHGKGLSYKHYQELLTAGVDCFTSGNHYFQQKDVFDPNLDFAKEVRPYNLDPHAPGVGSKVFSAKDGTRVEVTNMMGRAFLSLTQSNPFYGMDEILRKSDEKIHIVDFHAEATAEKRLFAEYLDGRVTAVIGTHTHVMTMDSQLLHQGTFFLTDSGMCGPLYSSIGDSLASALPGIMTGIPHRFEVETEGPYMVNGVNLLIDRDTGKVLSYTPIREIKEA